MCLSEVNAEVVVCSGPRCKWRKLHTAFQTHALDVSASNAHGLWVRPIHVRLLHTIWGMVCSETKPGTHPTFDASTSPSTGVCCLLVPLNVNYIMFCKASNHINSCCAKSHSGPSCPKQFQFPSSFDDLLGLSAISLQVLMIFWQLSHQVWMICWQYLFKF